MCCARVLWCWCLVLRRTSSQTGFEGGESEIQILIGPNSTENSPQWFLFHYGQTGPHFRKMGVVSGEREGRGVGICMAWYPPWYRGAPNKKVLAFPTSFFSTIAVHCRNHHHISNLQRCEGLPHFQIFCIVCLFVCLFCLLLPELHC